MGLFSNNKVRVRVHIAYFYDAMTFSHPPFYFINILNTYKRKSITIEKIWFEWGGKRKHFALVCDNPGRELPVKLTPGEQWETWMLVTNVHADAFNDARVYYKTKYFTHIVKSVRRSNVPSQGNVPGGK
jgi:hypothetical protein